MSVKGLLILALGLPAFAAGCGQELDYRDRLGCPMPVRVPVTLPEPGQGPVPAATPGPRAAPSPSKTGDFSLVVAFPKFPPDGAERRCRIETVPPEYASIAVGLPVKKANRSAVIELRPLDAPQTSWSRGRTLALRIRDFDTPLPPELRHGQVVTLRFLKDGRFFDVKEWSVIAEAKK
jgi:hypothetical protein